MEHHNCMMWWRILWLTTDFWLYSGTNKGKYCWLLVQHPMAMDWIPLHTCIHVHRQHVSSSCLGKIFPQENTSYFPHCCIPDCSDPCSSGPCCSSVSVCDWDPQKRVGNQFTKLAPIHCTTALELSNFDINLWSQFLEKVPTGSISWMLQIIDSRFGLQMLT